MYLPTPNVRQTKHTNNIHYHNNITQLAEEIITNIHTCVQAQETERKAENVFKARVFVCLRTIHTHNQVDIHTFCP